MRKILFVVFFTLLLLVACTETQTKYVCSDGTTVSDPEYCPKAEPEIEVMDTTTYCRKAYYSTCGDNSCGVAEQEEHSPCYCPKDCSFEPK